jgi:hypothetical protein
MNNAQVRITEWQFEPGEAAGFRRHEFDDVAVPLVDSLLRLVAAGGGTRAALRTGVAYFRRADVEHDVIRAGDKPLASSRSSCSTILSIRRSQSHRAVHGYHRTT